MTQTPLISVVTACYNAARFLGDCLDSVRGQEDGQIEHIVVDGGSTDGTLDLLRADSTLKVTSEPDRGISDALNKGFARARGDWILWLNSDDYLLPGAVKTARALMRSHPTAEVLYANYYLVDEHGGLIQPVIPFPVHPLVTRFFPMVPSSGTFYRRSIFEDRRLWLKLNLRSTMDTELNARMIRAGVEMLKAESFFSAFRLHGANQSVDWYFSDRAARAEGKRKLRAEWDEIVREEPWLPDALALDWKRPLWFGLHYALRTAAKAGKMGRGDYAAEWMGRLWRRGEPIRPARPAGSRRAFPGE